METIVADARKDAIDAQRQWWSLTPRDRFRTLRRLASVIADRHAELVAAVSRNATPAEILASEILPLADACRYTAQCGPGILAPVALSGFAGAWWMGRIAVTQHREPWGLVFIVAPWNYPLLLPAVQVVQAIAAGNSVLVKPSPGCEKIMEVFRDCLAAADIPKDLMQILPCDVEAAEIAFKLGVDKVVLTGSAETGRKVLRQLANNLTPSTMELSGCDAVFIHPLADLKRAATAIRYALTMNEGATCIAPRRIFVTENNLQPLTELLTAQLADSRLHKLRPPIAAQAHSLLSEAIQGGATVCIGGVPSLERAEMRPTVLSNVRSTMSIAQADLFAPITSLIPVTDLEQALQFDSCSLYRLGASVFGPEPHATDWARKINAGCVTINDVMVPTADPRVAFGGRGHSGWGFTRGAEGLLDMTRLKVVCKRRGRWMPHLDPQLAQDPRVLVSLLKLFHARSWTERWKSLTTIVRSGSKK
jgi:acyl-CoA reductase-like NAD-dependent aldehyde dehydrogenase